MVRNCIYEISLISGRKINGRLADISKDTLFFTNYFNQNTAMLAGAVLDTFPVVVGELDKLHLIADRALGYYEKHSFKNFDFVFRQTKTHCALASGWEKIYNNDEQLYEIVPHLTAQGVNFLFEENGRTYFYYGNGYTKPDRSKIDRIYRKTNGIVFTPCKREEVNGLAIGMRTKNTKNEQFAERDSLVLRGLALEINPFAIFSLMNPRIEGPFPDSLSVYYEQLKPAWTVKLHGMNLSLVNTINEMDLHGVSVSGCITAVDEIHGVSISGISNFCYVLKGISIAALRNRSTHARGLQIALFNRATDLRGIQLGLWNRNAKRSLPIVNWQFKP